VSESIKCVLEVYAAATFSLSMPKRTKAGVVGDNIVFTVNTEAVGSYAGSVAIAITGYPSGAGITYSPPSGIVTVGSPVTITIDTDACVAGISNMTVTGT
jgi:hypothetical protein